MENNQIVLNDEIFNKAKEGDRNALALLCKKSMNSAYFIALKILKNETDAEDIASESMITIIEKIHTLQDIKAYDGWVNRIVTNKCYDFIKKMKPVLCGDYSSEYIDGAELEEYNKEFLPEEFALDNEKRKILMDVIKNQTNEMEMMTIMMFYYNDESIGYIAEHMNCAEITVKKRLASARKKIKDGIEKKYGKGVAFMATGLIFVLGKAMKAEASEFAVPIEAAANIMSAAGAAASRISAAQTVNGGTNMSDMMNNTNNIAGNGVSNVSIAEATATVATTTAMATKAGLGFGAIAGICAGIAGVIAAVSIGLAVMLGGNSDKSNDIGGMATTSNIESSIETTEEGETSNIETDTTETITEEITTEETTTKPEYEEIPFEQYVVSELGYVAKSVYTTYDDECSFIWSHTEDDILNWFRENHKANDVYDYKVSNLSGLGVFDEREVLIYTPRKREDGKPFETCMNQNQARCIMVTSSYNKKVPSSVEFQFENKNQEEVIAEVSKFIEFMGFSEYTEKIIHNSYQIDVETENKLGEYIITTNYSYGKIYGTYTLSVKFEYMDKKYEEENNDGIVPEKIEKWDDYNKLSDYLTNTEFDNSSTEAMAKNISEYAVSIGMNNTLKYYGPYIIRFNYSYTSADETKIIEDAVCNYVFEGMDSEDDKDALDDVQRIIFGINYEGEKFSNIMTNIYLTPVYNKDRDSKYTLNEDDINNLTEKRMQILSMLDPTFEVTKEKMLEIYQSEDSYRIDNEDRTYSYTVYNEFDMLCYIFRATIW